MSILCDRKVLEPPGSKVVAAPEKNGRASPEASRKSKKSTKGWDGEKAVANDGSIVSPKTSAISLVSG